MELIILASIILIWLIFAYEFIQTNPKKKGISKTLTADEVSSTEDEIIRARTILKNLKGPEAQKEKDEQEVQKNEEILPDPFSDQNNNN